MRLFVALPLPERVTAALERIQEGVLSAYWVPPESMHLTLRYIGEADGGGNGAGVGPGGGVGAGDDESSASQQLSPSYPRSASKQLN